MVSNQAMSASEVTDKSPVLGADEDKPALATDIVACVESAARDPALKSVLMSWFPSGTW
jgi:hypothetical protein